MSRQRSASVDVLVSRAPTFSFFFLLWTSEGVVSIISTQRQTEAQTYRLLQAAILLRSSIVLRCSSSRSSSPFLPFLPPFFPLVAVPPLVFDSAGDPAPAT